MRKYNLLLIKAAQMIGSRVRKDYKGFLPNITLPVLAAYVPSVFDIEILDDSFEEIDFSKRYSIVAITALQINTDRAIWIAKRFKEIWGEKTLVVGGGISISFVITEGYFLAEDYREKILKYFDHIFIGESDYTWRDFLNNFSKGIKAEKIIYPLEKPDLKDMPFPRMDLIKWHLYNKLPIFKGMQLGYFIPVETARGCPFNCAFCCVTKYWGKHVRYRPAKEVVAHLKKLPPNSFIIFTDDNIISIPKYAKELFELMIKERINQKFFAQFAIHGTQDPELLRLASNAGCKLAYLGMESIKPESLISVKKFGNIPNQIQEFIKKGMMDEAKVLLKKYYSEVFSKFKKYNIHPFPSVIVGLPGDNVKNINETIQFLMDENIVMMTQWLYAPLVGATDFRDFDSIDGVKYKRFGWYDGSHIPINTEKKIGVMNREIEKAFWKTYQNFYSIKNIFKRILKNKIPFDEKLNLIIVNLFYYRAAMQRLQPFTFSLRTKWICSEKKQ